MDDNNVNRSPVVGLRNQFTTRTQSSDDRLALSDELASDTDTTPETPAPSRRKSREVNTASQFSGALVPVQFKLPADLVQSLKLHSINSGETMSEIVLRCMTSADLLEKAWISTRKAS